MSIAVTGYHHIRLTVCDGKRSRACYDAPAAPPCDRRGTPSPSEGSWGTQWP